MGFMNAALGARLAGAAVLAGAFFAVAMFVDPLNRVLNSLAMWRVRAPAWLMRMLLDK
jgi:hypothetical protein